MRREGPELCAAGDFRWESGVLVDSGAATAVLVRGRAGLSVLQTVDLLTEQSSLGLTENGLKQRKYPVGENALLMSEESGQTALS